ncbi:MAG: hypothetical protein HQK50_07790 [Oligoflexia bacterium]|nr:hypothetical protein [Oligoflexia bacterium]MBF0365458.1 hypothetical protein [Oligoflexia bacterium]
MKSIKFAASLLLVILLLCTVVAVVGGCGKTLPYEVNKAKSRDIVFGDGVSRSISVKSELPIVLLFSEVLCGSCMEEHQQISKDVVDRERFKEKVQMITVMVGSYESDRERVDRWGVKNGAFWPLLTDGNGVLFAKYCRENIFPCVVIFMPEQGMVYSKNAKVGVSEIKSVVGDWNQGEMEVEPPVELPTPVATPAIPIATPMPTPTPTVSDQQLLRGSFAFNLQAGGEQVIDLAQNGGKKSLLLLASTGCINCVQEHEEIAKKYSTWPQINIYSALINLERKGESDADYDWEMGDFRSLGVTWPVADIRIFSLFEKFCLNERTPCTLLFNEENHLIFLRDEKFPLEELRSHL